MTGSSKEEIFTQIHEHTEEREKAATHKPRKEISEEINHDGALILDISYEKFSVCYLSLWYFIMAALEN